MGKDIDWDKLTFSLTPTDTMYVATTSADDPWMPGDLRPYGNIEISPAAGAYAHTGTLRSLQRRVSSTTDKVYSKE